MALADEKKIIWPGSSKIETPKPDMDVIHERLKRAKEIAHEKQKEKSKKEK